MDSKDSRAFDIIKDIGMPSDIAKILEDRIIKALENARELHYENLIREVRFQLYKDILGANWKALSNNALPTPGNSSPGLHRISEYRQLVLDIENALKQKEEHQCNGTPITEKK